MNIVSTRMLAIWSRLHAYQITVDPTLVMWLIWAKGLQDLQWIPEFLDDRSRPVDQPTSAEDECAGSSQTQTGLLVARRDWSSGHGGLCQPKTRFVRNSNHPSLIGQPQPLYLWTHQQVRYEVAEEDECKFNHVATCCIINATTDKTRRSRPILRETIRAPATPLLMRLCSVMHSRCK